MVLLYKAKESLLHNAQIEQNIKAQFVNSLMEYFKIEEDINLRGHIADLVRNIDKSQYREFLRRLSGGNMTYKTAFEKIALVAESFEEELKNMLFSDVKRRVKQLYDIMYELHRQISQKNEGNDALESFCNVYFSKIKDKNSDKVLFDTLDIEVIRDVTKEWIFNTVVFDKSLFMLKVENSYKNCILIEHNAIKNVALKHTSTKQLSES